MGQNLHYVARRGEPLTPQERRAVDRIIEHYSVVEQIDAFAEMGQGANWESFVVFDPADPSGPDVVFEGAAYVRDHPPEHTLAVLRHRSTPWPCCATGAAPCRRCATPCPARPGTFPSAAGPSAGTP